MAKTNDEIASAKTPEQSEAKMTVVIDPKRTRGGIRVNGKLYVGKVTVSEEQGEDLLRIQEEYAATFEKLFDPSIKLKNQNIDVSKKLYMADPEVYGANPKFNRVYGLLDSFQFQFISETDRKEWAEERFGLYGY